MPKAIKELRELWVKKVLLVLRDKLAQLAIKATLVSKVILVLKAKRAQLAPKVILVSREPLDLRDPLAPKV